MDTSGRFHHLRSTAFGATTAVALAIGCAASIHVRTAEAPDAALNGSTYRFLPPGNSTVAAANSDVPTATTNTVGGDVVTSQNPARTVNPILESPIVLQYMRREIERDLAGRGYHRQQEGADLSVAYYLGVRHKLQVTDYGYGYPFWGWHWRWGRAWDVFPAQEITEYQEGTLIIDVLDASGRHLQWRGMGHIDVPSNPDDYSKVITKGVDAILAKFPGHAT